MMQENSFSVCQFFVKPSHLVDCRVDCSTSPLVCYIIVEESGQMPFPGTQQVNLRAFSQHFLFCAEREEGKVLLAAVDQSK